MFSKLIWWKNKKPCYESYALNARIKQIDAILITGWVPTKVKIFKKIDISFIGFLDQLLVFEILIRLKFIQNFHAK